MRRHAIAAIVSAHLLLAVVLTFSGIHRLHTADSIIFTLNSLYIHAPFFWQQDRVGMLVPLVLSWVHDPFANLLANTGATIFAGLLAPVLLALTLRLGTRGVVAATLLNAIFLATAPALLVENQFIVCCYPLAMALGFGGIVLLPRDGTTRWRYPRLFAAGLCAVAAFWVYVAVVVVLLPLVVLRVFAAAESPATFRERLRRTVRTNETWRGVGYCFFGLAVGFAAMVGSRRAYAVGDGTPMGMLPPEEWPATVGRFFAAIGALPQAEYWLVTWGGLLIAGFIARLVLGGSGRTPWPAILSLFALGLGELAFASSREWTVQNLHHPRYLLGLLLSWQLAAALLLVGGIRWPARVSLAVGVVAVLFAAAVGRYGLPSSATVRAIVDQEMGTNTERLLAADCDAYHANYWALWPAIYHANLVRTERGDPRAFLPIGMRAEFWRPRWEAESARRPLRVAMPPDDREDFDFYRDRWRYAPSRAVERRDGLQIHTLTERFDPAP